MARAPKLTEGLAEDATPFRLRPDEPDDENPEWTDEDFARAKTIWDFPDIVEILQKHGQLGRPPLAPEAKKRRVTLYLDPDVIDALKSPGKGWQTRANAALRQALGLSARDLT
jgi:uncharacterized protein (DUF4415 family)